MVKQIYTDEKHRKNLEAVKRCMARKKLGLPTPPRPSMVKYTDEKHQKNLAAVKACQLRKKMGITLAEWTCRRRKKAEDKEAKQS